jgi:hypothetical protein
MPITVGGVHATFFPLFPPPLCNGAESGRGIESGRSSGDVGVHGGCNTGKKDGVSSVVGGLGASGVSTQAARQLYVFSRCCSGVDSGGVVSLPVKIEHGSHIRMPGCASAYRATAGERAPNRHATVVGVEGRLQV